MHHRVALMPLLLLSGLVLGGGCENEETGGGATACEDLLVQEPCLDCLETSCCELVQACIADQGDAGCAACIQGDADACARSSVAIDLYTCLLGACSGVCSEDAPGAACDVPADPPSGGACVTVEGGGVECNPLTSAECDGGAGEACDYDAGQFRCFPGPNDRGLCEACGTEAGNCGPGLSCFQQVAIGAAGVAVRGTCARTCCDDADCGEGVCGAQVTADGQSVGVCLERSE